MSGADDPLRGDEMSLGDAMRLALAYAQAGIPAFPVKLTWDNEKHAINKVPLTEHGFKDASCDPRDIRRMFNKTHLDENEVLGVGLWPGPAGYVVLDVDTKGGARGDDELARLEAEHGALPDSLRVTTASGGGHIWLTKNGQTIGNTDLAPDVEVRADAGYVMAAGVWCPWGEWAWDGGIGLLDGGKVDDAPRWLLDTLGAPATNGTGTTGHWRKVDETALHPADLAALQALRRLGGHSEFKPHGKDHIEITRPGKRAGTSATIGYIGPGIVKVFTANWPKLPKGVYDADKLEAIADGRSPGNDRYERDRDAADDQTSSWRPIDLAAALAGEGIPPPEVLTRIDGKALLYRGRTHAFQGESESLKTFCAIVAAAQVLEAGDAVVWVDFEGDEIDVTQRLRALGVPVEAILERFTYLRPDEPLCDRQGNATVGNVDLGLLLKERSYALAVIDGVTEAMSTEGLDLISNADIATWSRRLPKRLAATGAATVGIDHVTKARTEGGSRYAIGAQHKLAGLTGAAYRFDLVRPLSRTNTDEPVTGVTTITVTKDRPGYVRAHSIDGRVAVLEVTGWPDGGVTAALSPITGEPAPDLGLVKRIAGYLEQYEGASTRRVEENVEGKGTQIRTALRWMAAEDRSWVRIEKKGQAHLHYLTDAGKELL